MLDPQGCQSTTLGSGTQHLRCTNLGFFKTQHLRCTNLGSFKTQQLRCTNLGSFKTQHFRCSNTTPQIFLKYKPAADLNTTRLKDVRVACGDTKVHVVDVHICQPKAPAIEKVKELSADLK